MFRILHISDLHFGSDCRFDLDGRRAAQALATEVQNHGFEEFSAVAISGDFTRRNQKPEFDASRDFIAELGNFLALPLANFVLIPGNHDITWSDADEHAFRKFRYLYREQAEKAYREFLDSLGLPAHPYLMQVKIFHDDHIAIVGFNSCGLERKLTAGFGYLGRDQVEAALRALRQDHVYQIREASFFKIAVLHHHLLPAVDLDVSELEKPPHLRHFSLTLDAHNVLNLLLGDNFALALHGHVHVPFCGLERRIVLSEDEVGVPRNGHLAVVAAGSVTVNPPHCSRNQFHVIEIDEKAVSIHAFERDPSGPSFGRCGEMVRIRRHLITKPSASLSLRSPEDWLESLHQRRIQESSLLAESVLVDGDAGAMKFLQDIVMQRAKRHEVLLAVADDVLGDAFDSVLASLRAEPDPVASYEDKKNRSAMTFPEYIVRLMAAYVI